MKIDFIADTNILIYTLEGNDFILPFLNYNFGISFISEVELLGFQGISISQEKIIKKLIFDCFFFDWNSQIKDQTILLRKLYRIKLPDAIIAATAIVNNLPLITADKGFSKIENLELILIET